MIQLKAEVPAVLANDFKKLWGDIETDVLSAVSQVGESGWYILGNQVKGFEASLSHFWGLPHTVGVANGMDAIEIGLRVLGLQPGDKVLTTPLSAFATTLAILRAGGVPVFVDVDIAGQLDLKLAEQAIQKHGIRFMVPVHLYGQSLDLDFLGRLKAHYELSIVEDCAQAIGAHWQGRPVGTVGQIATTSFYPTKNLGAMGDAGALLTADPDLAQKASCYRDYGQSEKYIHAHKGLNSRLDEVQAAILQKAMLPRLKAWGQRRQAIAVQYLEALKNPALNCSDSCRIEESVWHLFPVLTQSATQRDEFIAYLKSNGIGAAIHYPLLIPDQPVMVSEAFVLEGELHNAKRFAQTEVSLPIHPYMTGEDVERVINICNSWTALNA